MFWKFVRKAVAAAGLASAVWAGAPAALGQTADVITGVERLPDATAGTGGAAGMAAVPVAGPQATLSGIPLGDGCSSCGGGMDCLNGPVGCGEGGCYPGGGCKPMCGRGPLTNLYAAFHNAICCPDPCYVPQWRCAANAALFVDHARPTTMTRIRWDYGNNLTQPDRAGYFWQQIGGGGPNVNPARVNYHELRIYQEAGVDKFSFFFDLGFRSVEPNVGGGSGGFGDVILGTKSLLLDSDVLQLSFQFATTLPAGAGVRGLGIGQVALDPSLLMALKLRENTYTQGQIGYWFGVGGTAGSVLHYANSLNQVLWKPSDDITLVGSLEGVGYSFLTGSVANPAGGRVSANGTTYYSVGPGLRWCICNRVDVGFGMQFAVTSQHFAEQQYRTELPLRF